MSNWYEEHLKTDSTCPICGKKFIPTPDWYWAIGSYNTYTADDSGSRHIRVCSYSCMRKWEKEQEAKINARKINEYSSEAISLIKSRMPNETYERFVDLRYRLHYSLKRIADTLGYEKRQIERYSVEVQKLITDMNDIKDGHIVY